MNTGLFRLTIVWLHNFKTRVCEVMEVEKDNDSTTKGVKCFKVLDMTAELECNWHCAIMGCYYGVH